MTVERRRAERRRTDWTAHVRLDGDDEWRPCRVIDVSFDGAALELDAAAVGQEPGAPVQLRVQSIAGGDAGIQLSARLRRVERSAERVVAGLEFSEVRDEERRLLQLLVGLRSLE